MDKYTVGTNAGIVWRLLDDNRRMEYREVKKCTGMSNRDLNAAIGWLFCENKIQVDTHVEEGEEYLYLELNLYIG